MFPSCRGGGPITCSNDAVSSARRPESCVVRYDKEKSEARVGGSPALGSRLPSAPTAEGGFPFEDGTAAVLQVVRLLGCELMMRLRVL